GLRVEISVDLVGRDVVEAACTAGPILIPRRTRRLQQLVSAPHVGIDERIRTVDRAIDVRFRGKVHDGVDSFALDNLVHRIAVSNVSLHKREMSILCEWLEARKVTGIRQSVQSDDLVIWMVLRPELDEVAADKTGRSRYKYPTHRG